MKPGDVDAKGRKFLGYRARCKRDNYSSTGEIERTPKEVPRHWSGTDETGKLIATDCCKIKRVFLGESKYKKALRELVAAAGDGYIKDYSSAAFFIALCDAKKVLK